MEEKTIFLVDDDEEIVSLLQKKLEMVGYSVVVLTKGEHVLQKAKMIVPNLILMDIVLPDIDGAEVVKSLQEDGATENIPVIFLSGIVTKEQNNAPSEVTVGGKTYKAIGKPFSAQQLLDEIKMVL